MKGNASLQYTYACSSISLKTHYNPCAYCFTMAKTGEKYQLTLGLRITETKERGWKFDDLENTHLVQKEYLLLSSIFLLPFKSKSPVFAHLLIFKTNQKFRCFWEIWLFGNWINNFKQSYTVNSLHIKLSKSLGAELA